MDKGSSAGGGGRGGGPLNASLLQGISRGACFKLGVAALVPLQLLSPHYWLCGWAVLLLPTQMSVRAIACIILWNVLTRATAQRQTRKIPCPNVQSLSPPPRPFSPPNSTEQKLAVPSGDDLRWPSHKKSINWGGGQRAPLWSFLQECFRTWSICFLRRWWESGEPHFASQSSPHLPTVAAASKCRGLFQD